MGHSIELFKRFCDVTVIVKARVKARAVAMVKGHFSLNGLYSYIRLGSFQGPCVSKTKKKQLLGISAVYLVYWCRCMLQFFLLVVVQFLLLVAAELV